MERFNYRVAVLIDPSILSFPRKRESRPFLSSKKENPDSRFRGNDRDEFMLFLDSQFFSAIATLLTGLLVIVVYKIEKRKEKRDGATIVLMEIRNAENSIRTLKDYGIRSNVSIVILPTNSWLKFNHLFVKKFDRDELESLNNFYNQCSLAQREVERLNSFGPIALEEKAKVIYPKLLELSEKYGDKDSEYNLRDGSDYTRERKNILATYYAESEYFLPQQPIDDLLKYVNNIENISISTAG